MKKIEPSSEGLIPKGWEFPKVVYLRMGGKISRSSGIQNAVNKGGKPNERNIARYHYRSGY